MMIELSDNGKVVTCKVIRIIIKLSDNSYC